jgi:cytochrome c-type protein NapC
MNLGPAHLVNYIALAAAAAAALILLLYLFRRPHLDMRWKVLLFVGVGPLPITAAMLGNITGFEGTKDRRFCGSCHTMDMYVADAEDKSSGSLAAIHSRNPYFGEQSCYICHADYGMFGLAVTKLGGMRHMWYYYTENWEAPDHPPPKMLEPYSHVACKQCHPPDRPRQPLEHQVHRDAILKSEVGCTAAGCHGRPHPVNPKAAKFAASEAP